MIDFNQIEKFYSKKEKQFKRNILREYLQYKILEIIFDSKFKQNLIFMGGTASRILYGNNRFSEDLDFDNKKLEREDFEELTSLIKMKLELEGYSIELRNVFKEVFRSYIRFLHIVFNVGLSSHKEEKLLIQLDTESQFYNYEPERIILNKFDIFLRVNVVPVDLLLSQKITAIFTRERSMGRDFYDTVFLWGMTKPDLRYLNEKLGIKSFPQLKKKLLSKCDKLNFQQLARDVSPFLTDPSQVKRVELFPDFIEDI